MPTTPVRRREFTRLASLGPDPRVDAIRRAVGACTSRSRSRLKEHVRDGDYVWPERFVQALDELTLDGATPDELVALGEAFADAARRTAFSGNAAPQDPIGTVLAAESIAEGEANRDAALLLDAPHSLGRLHQALHSATRHIAKLQRWRLVLHREIREVERS